MSAEASSSVISKKSKKGKNAESATEEVEEVVNKNKRHRKDKRKFPGCYVVGSQLTTSMGHG